MRRLARLAALIAILSAAIPVAWVTYALVNGRDLAGGWRSWRAASPQPAKHEAPLAPAPFAAGVHVGNLTDRALPEVSGLVASRRRPDVLWAVNDSGNPLDLFALSLDGRTLRRFDVEVPVPKRDADWEDLAALVHEGTPYLVIADVGDNSGWRRRVRLWVVEEPDLDAAPEKIAPRWRIELRYPDGPRDCEAVAVDPVTLTALFVTKRDWPPRLYEAPLAPLLAAGGGEAALALRTELSGLPRPSRDLADPWSPEVLHMPTALDLAPDGSAAVLLTYAAAFHYPRAPGETWAAAFARAPSRLHLPALGLAEALAWADGSLYVTSEVDPASFLRWRPPLVRFDAVARAETE